MPARGGVMPSALKFCAVGLGRKILADLAKEASGKYRGVSGRV